MATAAMLTMKGMSLDPSPPDRPATAGRGSAMTKRLRLVSGITR